MIANDRSTNWSATTPQEAGYCSHSSTWKETKYVYHKSFRSPSLEAKLWGPERLDVSVPYFSLCLDGVEGDEVQTTRRKPLTRQQEEFLFLRYNYAKYRLSALLRRQARGDSVDAEAVETWRRRARTAQESLVHANLALVPSLARKRCGPEVELADLLSEGYMAVLRCINKFDVSRGFKFSTYACRSILTSFYRLSKGARRYRRRFPVQFDPDLEQFDSAGRLHQGQRQDALEALRTVMRDNSARLNRTEAGVIARRHLPARGQRPYKLAQVSERLGIPAGRVRQIEHDALAKLRCEVNRRLAR